jgi:hypothetical protein
MITLKEWMEVVDYRITEGSAYSWQCFGANAYCLDSWDGDQDGHSLSITFDQKTQTVYEVQIHDYRNQRAYRMITQTTNQHMPQKRLAVAPTTSMKHGKTCSTQIWKWMTTGSKRPWLWQRVRSMILEFQCPLTFQMKNC